MIDKLYYRKVARYLDEAMVKLEQLAEFVEGSQKKDGALLEWCDEGEAFFQKYKELRDKTPTIH